MRHSIPKTRFFVFIPPQGEELCHCKFSLAYGGKILLNNAVMRLVRGRRYGLCGANGAGKSTLMKAIAAGKVGCAAVCICVLFIHRMANANGAGK